MIEIIPAMDLIGGKCVRLTQGDFLREKVYADDPLETAKRFEAAGLSRLHMVDLDGARSGAPANLNVLSRVASGTSLLIDYGGGIKSEADVAAVFDAGAVIVNVGSLAVRQPETFLNWIGKYGGDKILLAADTKNGKVAIDGWQTETEEEIVEYLCKLVEKGVRRAFVTDIASDGAMSGPSIDLYREIIATVPGIDLIASGGVRSLADIDELESIGCKGVIIGKALYERTIVLEGLTKYVG
ncbi:MAG: 1-(5-phosphoribosyl)-5-[(5-phosphoribosylamino)methylideneamino]imidazole-4-carboxamide isomerase [Blastocatellia bacterium]|nr:1-(5-phosphoribosyl)-5-[(5-phosphoribosylamino)methylideneamino]imidazole-4-carboxamide isomerase [Blastocatellia bacterium]